MFLKVSVSSQRFISDDDTNKKTHKQRVHTVGKGQAAPTEYPLGLYCADYSRHETFGKLPDPTHVFLILGDVVSRNGYCGKN